MQAITTRELLNFWERNLNNTMIQRALDLLCCASPEMKPEVIAVLNIGERDARLMVLREWLFGSKFLNRSQCPVCSEQIEWETDINDIRMQWPKNDVAPRKYLLKKDGYSIRFRMPDSNDLAAVIADAKPEKLFEKIVFDCKFRSKTFAINQLPEKILEAIDNRIEEENPQADIIMNVRCPNCSHQWEMQFDIVSYLWDEINSWARRILQDIDSIAQAYGWSEQDILNMSPARRQIYSDIVNS